MLGSKEISQMLGVQAVTVRKYAAALEKAGYSVSKSASGHREYTEVDATVFRQLKALCEQSGMTLELAANVVVSRNQRASESVAPAVIEGESKVIEQYNERYNDALKVIGELVEQNRAQADQMDRLHKRMDEQHSNISLILREMQDTRRMIAATTGRKWWEFWKKDQPDGPDPEASWNRKQKPENYL